MKFERLLGQMVLVLPDSVEEKKVRGVIHPAQAQQERQQQPTGEVVMCGPGDEDNPMTVKVGDRVFYVAQAAVEHDGEQHHLVPVSSVMGIVEPR
jgi:chaperonin GroES